MKQSNNQTCKCANLHAYCKAFIILANKAKYQIHNIAPHPEGGRGSFNSKLWRVNPPGILIFWRNDHIIIAYTNIAGVILTVRGTFFLSTVYWGRVHARLIVMPIIIMSQTSENQQHFFRPNKIGPNQTN